MLPSGVRGGKSPGTEDGNGDGSGVTGRPGAVMGRGANGAAAGGGSLDLAARMEPDFGFAGLALAFTLPGGFLAAPRLSVTFFLRAGAPRFLDLDTFLETFFFALRFLAMIVLRSFRRPARMALAADAFFQRFKRRDAMRIIVDS